MKTHTLNAKTASLYENFSNAYADTSVVGCDLGIELVD